MPRAFKVLQMSLGGIMLPGFCLLSCVCSSSLSRAGVKQTFLQNQLQASSVCILNPSGSKQRAC